MLERTNQANFFPSSFPTGTIVNHIIKERSKNQSGKERERTHGWKEYRVCSQAAVRVSCRSRFQLCTPHLCTTSQRCQQPLPLRRKGPSLPWVFLVLLLTTSLPGPEKARAGTQTRWGLCICLDECSCSKTWENKSFPLQTGNKLAEIHPTKHHGLSNYVMCGWVYFTVIYSVVCTLSKKLSAARSKYKRRVV